MEQSTVMSQPDEILPPSPPFDTPTMIPSPTGNPLAGPSIEKRTPRIDHVFNFQIVVFEVEGTLFQVLRNSFNVPGTPFEAMFTLPQTETSSIEGSLENPIYLPGIKEEHFRSFLRILHPFIDRTPVVKFDEWVGVLNLATMWLFQEIRAKAIAKLSTLIKKKKILVRIALARKYRVAKWLRDAYFELTQKVPLNFEELRPVGPHSNSLDGNLEATSRDWETIAKILYLQTKAAATVVSFDGCHQHCSQCNMYYGNSKAYLCKCRFLAMVDEDFREELESLKENTEHVEYPLPSNSTESDSADLVEISHSSKKKKKVNR